MPQPDSPGVHRLRLRHFLLVPVACLIGLVAWRVFGRHGISRSIAELRARGDPTNLAELLASRTNPPPEMDGAPLVLAAWARLEHLDPKRIPAGPIGTWSPTDLAWATSQEKDPAAAAALELLRQAAGKPRFRFMATDGRQAMPGFPPDPGQPFTEGARFLAFHARLAARGARPNEAGSRILDAFRLSFALEDGGTLMSENHRQRSLEIVFDALADVLGTAAPDPVLLRKIEESCQRAGSTWGMADGLRLSRALALEYQTAFPTPPGAPRVVVIHDTAYRLLGGQASDLTCDIETSIALGDVLERSGAARIAGIRQLRERFDAGSGAWDRAHARIVLPPLFALAERVHQIQTLAECARAACAIERHRARNAGALPDTLAGLVPGFLPELPNDPMDDKPLRYRRLERGYVVYSVGMDGVDDGGVPTDPQSSSSAGDIPLQVIR